MTWTEEAGGRGEQEVRLGVDRREAGGRAETWGSGDTGELERRILRPGS